MRPQLFQQSWRSGIEGDIHCRGVYNKNFIFHCIPRYQASQSQCEHIGTLEAFKRECEMEIEKKKGFDQLFTLKNPENGNGAFCLKPIRVSGALVEVFL